MDILPVACSVHGSHDDNIQVINIQISFIKCYNKCMHNFLEYFFLSPASMLGIHWDCKDCFMLPGGPHWFRHHQTFFWTVSLKWANGLNSSLAYGYNLPSGCTLFQSDQEFFKDL